MSSQKNSPAASMFEKVLRAFETRGITYSDVLARLRRLLATGASPTELLAILRRRESAERMPEYARLEALLIEAVEQSAVDDDDSGPAQPRDPMTADPRGSPPGTSSGTSVPNPSPGAAAAEPQRPEGEVALDLQFDAPARALNTPRGLRASELDLSVLARHLRSAEERLPPRGASLEALTRSFEKAREGESAAAERAAALSADLAAAGAALQAEQGKLREVEQALAQSVAAGEAAREAALRELQQYQAELRTLRDSLAERDAALDKAKLALSERDAALDKAKLALSERDAALDKAKLALSERDAALDRAKQVLSERDAALDRAKQTLSERDTTLNRAQQALSERDTTLNRAQQALSERDSRLAALSRERTALERALEARTQLAADSVAAAPRDMQLRAPVVEPPAAPTVDAGREEAPAPPAPPGPTLSPELPRSRRLGGPARAIGWSAAALLVAAFAWLFAHRSPPQPARADRRGGSSSRCSDPRLCELPRNDRIARRSIQARLRTRPRVRAAAALGRDRPLHCHVDEPRHSAGLRAVRCCHRTGHARLRHLRRGVEAPVRGQLGTHGIRANRCSPGHLRIVERRAGLCELAFDENRPSISSAERFRMGICGARGSRHATAVGS